MTRFAASTDTPNCSAIPFTLPEGEEEANVALTTSSTETTVMYHRRGFDQFFGFSMSLGAKSSKPSEFRCGFSEASRAFERYGLAVGRERMRSIRSMAAMITGDNRATEMLLSRKKRRKCEEKRTGKCSTYFSGTAIPRSSQESASAKTPFTHYSKLLGNPQRRSNAGPRR